VLVARAAGQPISEFYRERIFEPLGMEDTSFTVAPADLHRLTPCFVEGEGGLQPFDDDGAWSEPRAFTDGGAGLASTARDYLAFGRMVLAGGVHDGTRLVDADLMRAMTSDQLSPGQRASAGPILGGRGWGFGLSIIDAPEGTDGGPLGYGWSGGFGTVWLNAPAEDLVAVVRTQVIYGTAEVERTFWSGLYGALAD
jgi:CubicO group peptidase (beta-lactamase class C family)